MEDLNLASARQQNVTTRNRGAGSQGNMGSELLQVMNSQGSVLNDRIDIQRLKGNNWIGWKWQVTNILDLRGLKDVLTSSEPIGSIRERAARHIVASTLDHSVVNKVIHCQSVQEIWSTLTGIYENKTSFALTDLLGRMNSYRMNTLDQVENGISEIRSMAVQIQAMGGAVDANTVESAILRALPNSFGGFVTSWTFLDSDRRTLDNLQSHLLRTVNMIKNNDGEKNISVAKVARRENNKAKNKETKFKGTCHFCHKSGHSMKYCYALKKKKEQGKDKSSSEKKDEGKCEEENKASKDDETKDSTARAKVATIGSSKNAVDVSNGDYIKSTWLADTGASFHMTSHKEWLVNFEVLKEPIGIRMGDLRACNAIGKGFIETSVGIITDVYFVPELSDDLFSVSSCAINHSIDAVFTKTHVSFIKDEIELFRGEMVNSNTYEITFYVKRAKHVQMLAQSLTGWHQALAHTNMSAIKHMALNNIVKGLVITNNDKSKCIKCAKGKCKRFSHPKKTTHKVDKPGLVLHFDTVGPLPEPSYGNSKYAILCKDEYSSYRKIDFTETKSEIANRVKMFVNQSELETGNKALAIKTDNGTEFVNQNLRDFLSEKVISHFKTSPYKSEQNGFIEREVRTVTEAGRTMLCESGLPKEAWAEAYDSAVYVLNRVCGKTSSATPYEKWFGTKPSVSNIRKFGQSAIVYVQDKDCDKLDPKGEKLIFVGYTDTCNTYRFLNPDTGRVRISCNAVFLDDHDIEKSIGNPKDDKSGESSVNQIDLPDSDSDESVGEKGVTLFDSLSPKNEIAILRKSPPTSDLEDFADEEATSDEDDVEEFVDHVDEEDQVNSSSSTQFESPVSGSRHSNDKEFLTPACWNPSQERDEEKIATLRDRKREPNYMPFKLNIAVVDESTSKSTTGAVILYGGAPIFWLSKWQSMITVSFSEAEYVALCSTIKDIIYMRNIAMELNFIDPGPTKIYCDNQSVIRLATERSSQRARYMRVELAFAREHIDRGEIEIHHTKAENQLADLLTESLSISKFKVDNCKIMTSETSKLTMMIMLILALLTGVMLYQFEIVKPIIYQPMKHYVEKQTTQYIIDFQYHSPCGIILDTYTETRDPNVVEEMDVSFGLANSLYNECNEAFELLWLRKVKELLRQESTVPPPIEHDIQKRDIRTGIILGYCVTNFIKTVFSPLLPWEDNEKLHQLAEKTNFEAQCLAKFQKELNIMQTIQNGLVEIIRNNTRSIREQNRQLSHFVVLSRKLTWLGSYLQWRIIDGVIKHQVTTLEMAERLNITELGYVDKIDTDFILAMEIAQNTLFINTDKVEITDPVKIVKPILLAKPSKWIFRIYWCHQAMEI